MRYKKLGLLTGFVLAALLLASARASAGDLAPPDQPGPYHVGVTTFSATMSGGRVTRVQVYYPTSEPPDVDFRYTILTAAGSYQLRSALGATEDAVALPLQFPLVVHDHGGPIAGQDFQRVSQFPLHELMASHGFVTVVALHSSNAVTRVRDLSLVIDVMLARSADPDDGLFDSIDPDRIGISGNSAGGGAAISAAAGWRAHGILADPRIKAMLVYEPAVNSLDDASSLGIPYMTMGGLQSYLGVALPTLFEATALATPRIYVLTPSATHVNYLTSIGSEIDQTREAALLADPTLPEPLTHLTATNAAAARAYALWNAGQINFPSFGPGFGSGRNFCDRVGVNSVRSLDLDGDGFTDTPPFMADDPLLLARAIPEEVMIPLIMHYTVSFWKTFLEGDRRYMDYLTPGYAKRNQFEAIVTIE
jgi:dienelactone hydrolase